MRPHLLLLFLGLLAGCLVQPPLDDDDDDDDGDDDDTTQCEEVPWWLDSDGDGFGAPGTPRMSCDQPNQYVDNADDCDDLEGRINPSATEICDDYDNDCDGSSVAAGMVSARAQGLGPLDWTDVTASFAELIGGPGAAADWMLCEGTWATNLESQYDLTIIGRGDVTLDGEGQHKIASQWSAGTTLELRNVHIANGGGTASASIACGANTTVRLINSYAHDNAGLGLLAGDGCTVRVENTSIYNNQPANDLLGGTSGTWELVDSRIYDNTVPQYFAAVAILTDSTGSMAGTVIESNLGRAVDVLGGSMSCTDGAGFGAGLRDQSASIAILVGSEGSLSWNGCDGQNNAGGVQYNNATGEAQTLPLNGLDRTINCAPYAGGISCTST